LRRGGEEEVSFAFCVCKAALFITGNSCSAVQIKLFKSINQSIDLYSSMQFQINNKKEMWQFARTGNKCSNTLSRGIASSRALECRM